MATKYREYDEKAYQDAFKKYQEATLGKQLGFLGAPADPEGVKAFEQFLATPGVQGHFRQGLIKEGLEEQWKLLEEKGLKKEDLLREIDVGKGAGFEELEAKLRKQEFENIGQLPQYGAASDMTRRQIIDKIIEARKGLETIGLTYEGQAGEAAARDELEKLTGGAEEALKKTLEQNLKDIELGGKQARKQVGELYSEKGLLRSTFAQKGFEEVATKELATTGEERLTTEEQISGLYSFKKGIELDIQRKREQIEQAKTADELSAAINDFQFLKEAEMRQVFQQQLASMQINARKKMFMKQMVGTAIGQAATIWAVA